MGAAPVLSLGRMGSFQAAEVVICRKMLLCANSRVSSGNRQW